MSEGVFSALSRATCATQAAGELADQLRHAELGFVLFFCSAEYDLPALAAALQGQFPAVGLAGCTSAGELTPEGYARGCITAVGFDRRYFSIAAGLVEAVPGFSLLDAQALVAQLVEDCRRNSLAPIKAHSFALTLFDGLSSREEVVLAALAAALGDIPQFGGSAGDDNHLSRTHVYYNGAFHSGAAVLLLVNTWLEFEVFSADHIQPRSEKLVVTRADRQLRRVYELNAEPAAAEYAQLIGVPVGALDHRLFAAHPLALRINQNHYVRAIQQVHEDGSLSFYCAVENGIVLTAMRPGPLLANLQSLFEGLRQRLGPLLLTIGCDCVLRRLELESEGAAVAEVSALLRSQQVLGFNTYGEQFNGTHINQTFTGVAIGRPRERIAS